MARFDRAGRDAPAGVLSEAPALPRAPARVTAAEAARSFEAANARRELALGDRGRWRFEDKAGRREGQSFLSADPSRRMHETRGVSRWQARATYGDAGRGPADGIWPPPADDDVLAREDVSGADARGAAVDRDPDDPGGGGGAPASAPPSRLPPPDPEEYLSRTAMDMRARTDAFYASVAAKGPRRPVSPGAHRGRWEARAEVSRRREDNNSSDDLHAGRHEARAFFGDGGGKCEPVPWSERDERGGNRHAGRWEARGEWHDANVHLEMPNHGHYAPHVGRDAWEAGKYLKLPRGVHEAGEKDGVWDPGLWERRAEWPRGAALEPKRRRDDPDPGPRGQAPIGPRNESRTLAGVWEDRAEWHRDSDGHAPRDVGPLGHVRRGARRHEGRWEARAEWGRGRVHPKLEHASDEHEGRWEERAAFGGEGGGGAGRRATETPQARAARLAAANREYVRDVRDVVPEERADLNAARRKPFIKRGGGNENDDPALGDEKDAASSEDASLRFASSGRFAPRPTWAGDAPARNIPSDAEARRDRSRAAIEAASAAREGRRREEEEAGGGGGGGGGTGGDGSAEAPGAFARWMAGAGADEHLGACRRARAPPPLAYTRTPAAYRSAYDARNDAGGARANHGASLGSRDLDGRRRPRGGLWGGGGAGDDGPVDPDPGEGEETTSLGLDGMASVREAIEAASACATTRRERARAQLRSKVGIV